MLVISDGLFSLPLATLASNADPDDLAASLRKAPAEGGIHLAVERACGAQRRPGHTRRRSGKGKVPRQPGGGAPVVATGAARIDPASLTDVVLTHLHVDHVGRLLADGLRGRLGRDAQIHLAAVEARFWASHDFSQNQPWRVPGRAPIGEKMVCRHVPQPAATIRGGVRGGAMFPNHVHHPEWHNASDHDPEEAVLIQERLLRDLRDDWRAGGGRSVAVLIGQPMAA